MNFIKNQIIPGLIILSIISGLGAFGYFFIQGMKAEFAKPIQTGSVAITHEYQATTTVLITGTTYKAAQTRHLVASSTAGITLGSVVIASTTANTMAIYNATSSDAVVNGDGTLITTFPASAPQGTYTFDVWLDKGLVLDLASGFGGDYVVSFRR